MRTAELRPMCLLAPRLLAAAALLLLACMPLAGCVIQLESARVVQPWESDAAQPTAIYECRTASNRRAPVECLHGHGFGHDTRPYVLYAP